MLGDPDFFDVPTLKQMNLWPSDKMVAKELTPYIRRIKKSNVKILEIGIKKGDNVVYFLENLNCIEVIHGINPNTQYDEVLKKNTSPLGDKFKLVDNPDDNYDVLIYDGDSNLELLFEKYYPLLPQRGIISGNEHDKLHVKASLKTYRRKNKITAPLHISSGTVWHWFKP